MTHTPAPRSVITAHRARLRDVLDTGPTLTRRLVCDGLSTLAVAATLDPRTLGPAVQAWSGVAASLTAAGLHDDAGYAHQVVADLVRMGDIGEPIETEEGDEEPIFVPETWPVTEPVPA